MNHKRMTFLWLFLLALVAAISILIATRSGVGTTPDAVTYIGAARNLRDGKGLSLPFGEVIDGPMTHHAPLFSVLLGLLGKVGIDPLIGARWLGAIFLGALVFLVSLWLIEMTASTGIGFFAALLTLSAIPMLEIHAFAWSEPLFILLGFSGLYLLARFLTNLEWRNFWYSVVLISMTVLTRYAGLAFVGTGALSILLFHHEKFSKRIIPAFVYGFIGIVPFATWTLRNSLVAGTATSRVLSFHPVMKNHFIQALQTVSDWLFLPVTTSGILKATVILSLALVIVAVAIFEIRNARTSTAGRNTPMLLKIVAVFILVYGVFLLFSISFFDANIPLDNRILSPMFVALIFVGLFSLQVLLRTQRNRRFLQIGIALCLLLFSMASLYNGVSWILGASSTGLGFSSPAWQRSDFVTQLEKLPADALIVTNAPQAVYITSGKSALALPRKTAATTQQENENYFSELSELRTRLQGHQGYVIYLNLPVSGALQTEQELVDFIPLQIVFQAFEGTIYAASK